MLPRVALAVCSLSLTVAGTATLVTSARSSTDPGGLVVHEWGTFAPVRPTCIGPTSLGLRRYRLMA